MNLQYEYKLNLIEAVSLAEYKGESVDKVAWDASYDVFFTMQNESGETVIEHRLESESYHADLDEILESEALTAIEDGLSKYLVNLSANDELPVANGMTLNVEFTDNKNGVPTYRIITDSIVR